MLLPAPDIEKAQGWAGSVVPQWNPAKVDYTDAIDDNDALAMMLRLSREDGIVAGISTGANVVGAYRLAERLGPDAVVLTLAVDTAFKYMSARSATSAQRRSPRHPACRPSTSTACGTSSRPPSSHSATARIQDSIAVPAALDDLLLHAAGRRAKLIPDRGVSDSLPPPAPSVRIVVTWHPRPRRAPPRLRRAGFCNAVMPGRSAASRRSPRLGRGADRRGRGRLAPWRAAGCRASIRRA